MDPNQQPTNEPEEHFNDSERVLTTTEIDVNAPPPPLVNNSSASQPGSESESSKSDSQPGSPSDAEIIENTPLNIINEDSLSSGSDDELYDSDDSVEGSSALVDAAEDPVLSQLLEILYECMKTPDLTNRHQVSKEFSQQVIQCLVAEGTLFFLGKYVLPGLTRIKTIDLIAALGFNLPESVIEDMQYTDVHFEMALQVAMRYALTHRRRLAKPRTLDEVCEAILNASNILVVTGAGISTSLGIPDFRSDDGLYAQLEHLGLTDPQEVFDIRTFKQNPEIFYSVARKILPGSGLHSGTPTHKFIKLLNDHNKLLRNYTQNIDNLEQFTGVPTEKVVQCHGSFGSAHCITCNYEVADGELLFPDIKEGRVPKCPECEQRKNSNKRRLHAKSLNSEGDLKIPKFDTEDASESEDEYESLCYGVMKPDITFFGESLPARFDKYLFDHGDAKNCDLLLCFGTSLRVSPVSEIVRVVDRDSPQIYVSRTRAKHCTFECEFLGNCDDVVELLCQKLGWQMNHPMAKRPQGMPEDKFPKGEIVNEDGMFLFNDDEVKSELVAEATEQVEAVAEAEPKSEPKPEHEPSVPHASPPNPETNNAQ